MKYNLTAAAVMLAAFCAIVTVQAEDRVGQSELIAEGPENNARITQIGEEQRARIRQHNIRGGVISGMIYQRGIGNEASLTMRGGNLDGLIIQYGDDNSARLAIHGQDNSGTIAQFGNDNSAGLLIDGIGKDVKLIQHGDGHSFHQPIRVGGETPGGQPMIIRQY